MIAKYDELYNVAAPLKRIIYNKVLVVLVFHDHSDNASIFIFISFFISVRDRQFVSDVLT